MSSFNKIQICGYLGRDVESRFMPDGTCVANFSVATTERKKDRGGDSQDVTTWFRVSVFGRSAEACQQYLSKGSQVFCDGRLSLNEYTDKDGNKRTSLEVRASDVQFLSTKGDSQEAPQQRAASAGKGFGVEKGTGRVVSPPVDDGDSSIPF